MKTRTDAEVARSTSAAVVDEEHRDHPAETSPDAIELLQSWLDADDAEVQDQIETWEALKKALGEDRNSYRKLFP